MKYLQISISILLLVILVSSESENRKKKLLPLFTIYSFPNDNCDGGTKNGTCYSANECTNKGGTNSGSCANGFGVCCTFVMGCGIQSSENCTYFESSGSESEGACTAAICKCQSDICRIRLDFETFQIAQPDSDPVQDFTYNAAAATQQTNCNTDSFGVTSSSPVNVLCGTLNDEHMYIDATDDCNQMTMFLGSSTTPRTWSIKISQIECDSPLLPPSDCTQYFTQETDIINTYNFQGGSHLANQRQNICIRQEAGFCRVCFSQAEVGDFQLSNVGMIIDDGTSIGVVGMCCGYGTNDMGTMGYDCIMIPGLSVINGAGNQINTAVVSDLCGSDAASTLSAALGGTACTSSMPFKVSFNSDGFEFAMAVEGISPTNQNGFKLTYTQQEC